MPKNIRARSASRAALAACLVSATLAGGCASMTKSESAAPKKSLLDRMPWSKKDDKPVPYPNPGKLAAVWSPEGLTQIGRVPTRGFGGRIFFYDEKSRPVPVEGTLVVHGFDEDNKDAEGAVKRFEFTPEQLTRHFSQSDVGASYSVWIPWDAMGGQQRRISLVASFKTAEGKMLQGQPTIVMLPGAKTDAAAELAQRYSPDFRAWQQASSGNTPPSSGLTTTTISRSTGPSRATDPDPSSPPAAWNIARGPAAKSLDIAMLNSGDPNESLEIAADDEKVSPNGKPRPTRIMPASTRMK